MDFRARLRRAFPYLVIGIGGFALAYVIIFVFVLPSKIVPPPEQAYSPDSSNILRPIDTSVVQLPPDTGFPAATVPMATPAQTAVDLGPTDVPDLAGMALADARAVLNSYRLTPSVSRDTSSFQPPNTVLRQSPAPGTRIASGGTVTLVVSYFPPEGADSTQPGSTATVPPATPERSPAPPVTLPRPATPGSASTDSARRVPRRPLPPIIPSDTPAPAARPDTSPNPA